MHVAYLAMSTYVKEEKEKNTTKYHEALLATTGDYLLSNSIKDQFIMCGDF